MSFSKNICIFVAKKERADLEKKIFFERFYKDNYQKFFYFALRYLNNEEVCRDIVSNAFEYAWCELSIDRHTEWLKILFSFIHNKCVDETRRQKVKSRFMQAQLQLEVQESGAELLERNERVEMVEKSLCELPPKTQLILRECMVNHRTYKEVAEELELTDHAVKKHIVKGLKMLREKVKNMK